MAEDMLAQEVELLVRESRQVRAPHEARWKVNERRYVGDQWDTAAPDGLDQGVINRVMLAVLAHTSVQTEQRAEVKINPHEVNEPPVVFLSEGAMRKLPPEMLPDGLTPNQLAGQAPLDDELFHALASLAEPKNVEVQNEDGTVAEDLQDVPLLTEADFVMVDEAMIAENLQLLIDALWEKAGMDFTLVQQVFAKQCFGHQAGIIEWDAKVHCFKVKNVHPTSVFLAPDSSGVHDSAYVVYDEWMSVRKAIASMPDHEAVIRASATTGAPSGGDNAGGHLADFGPASVHYEREMVVVRHLWMRDQVMPMPLADAIAGGQVIEVDDGQGGSVLMDPDGNLMEEGGEGWPTMSGILQARIIGEKTVESGPSPFVDIPVMWNISLPIPFEPWGIGTPQHMEDLQQQVNRCFTYCANILRYNQSPEKAMPKSVVDVMRAGGQSLFSRPDRVIAVPDSLWQQYGGKIMDSLDQRSLSEGTVRFLMLLLVEIDNQASNPKVLQGQAPGRVESGKAIEALQSAARGTLGFSSLYTEHAIRHLVKVVLGLMLDYMPLEVWSGIVRKHPPQVIAVMRGMARRIHWIVNVEIASGRGMVKRQREEQALALRQLGALSTETLLEKMDVPDAQGEARRAMAEQGVSP